ncbi:MAG TPA: hypothetical protein H9668_09220 [Firmicutes bacterium]|nr:hypothetical protein [Bacillota bacterium]
MKNLTFTLDILPAGAYTAWHRDGNDVAGCFFCTIIVFFIFPAAKGGPGESSHLYEKAAKAS